MSDEKKSPYNWEERKYLWMDLDQLTVMLVIVPLGLGLGCFLVWAGLSDATPASENLLTKGFWIGVAPILFFAMKQLRANKQKEEAKKPQSK
jgi:threonine/homoserine/homoserine lactone efflux protein